MKRGVGAGFIAFAAGVAIAGSASAAHGPPAFVAPQSRQVAGRDAFAALRSVVLPSGARSLERRPRGMPEALAGDGPHTAYVDSVERHQWWVVPGFWRGLPAFVKAHPPAGARVLMWGSGGIVGRETYAFVVFGWPGTAGIRTRQLTVVIATLPGYETDLRVDANVAWLLPRSASARIGPGVGAVEVSQAVAGRAPARAFMVSRPAGVKALVTLTNGLPINQPGAQDGCNEGNPARAEEPEAQVTLTFRSAPAGKVIARAEEAADAEGVATCSPMAFSLDGVRQTPLLEGPRLVALAGRLLHVRL